MSGPFPLLQRSSTTKKCGQLFPFFLPLRIVVILPLRSVGWFRFHAYFCHSELWLFCHSEVWSDFAFMLIFATQNSAYFTTQRCGLIWLACKFLPLRIAAILFLLTYDYFATRLRVCFSTYITFLATQKRGCLPAKIFNYFCLHNIFCHPVFWPFTTRKGWLTFAYIALSGSQKCGRFTTPMCGKHIRLNSNFCHPWAWLFTTRIVALYHQDCGSLPPRSAVSIFTYTLFLPPRSMLQFHLQNMFLPSWCILLQPRKIDLPFSPHTFGRSAEDKTTKTNKFLSQSIFAPVPASSTPSPRTGMEKTTGSAHQFHGYPQAPANWLHSRHGHVVTFGHVVLLASTIPSRLTHRQIRQRLHLIDPTWHSSSVAPASASWPFTAGSNPNSPRVFYSRFTFTSHGGRFCRRTGFAAEGRR